MAHKGQIQFIGLLIGLMFIVLPLLVGFLAYHNLKNNDTFYNGLTAEEKEVFDRTEGWYLYFDWFSVIFLVLYVVVMIGSSFYSRQNPASFLINIVLTVSLFMGYGKIGEYFQNLQQGTLSDITIYFPKTMLILTNFPLINIALFFITLIIMVGGFL